MDKQSKIPKNSIRKIRKRRGLLQSELANLANINESEISMLENNKRPLSGKRIMVLCEVLKCSVPELFGEESLHDFLQSLDDNLFDQVISVVKEYIKRKNISVNKESFAKITLSIYIDSYFQNSKYIKFIDSNIIDNITSIENAKKNN